MSKLTRKHSFVDVSDYGRPVARFIAICLKPTRVSAIHVTFLFAFSGMLALYCIVQEWYFSALVLLIVKSILDAADGELARIKNQPSYVGRYLDSILDSVLNVALLVTIGWATSTAFVWVLLAFICMQTQGTLYNYYHVILRHRTDGEMTSKVFETHIPNAYPGESQAMVNILFSVYRILYKPFDELVYALDPYAFTAKVSPKWFMSLVSVYGLGFQLLLVGVCMALGWIAFVVPFVIGYSVLIPVMITLRRLYLK